VGLLLTALSSLGSCRPWPADTVSVNTERWVLTPAAISSLSSARETTGLGQEIRLGQAIGSGALYLKFPNTWRKHGRAARAFLTLTPREAVGGDTQPVPVEVWRVSSDWEPSELHAWSDKPDLGPPWASASITAAPPRELRIDVTELVRFAARNPERDFGLALLTRAGAGPGIAFATGIAGGNPPRLEVYVTRSR
jgi:hypothetical protein